MGKNKLEAGGHGGLGAVPGRTSETKDPTPQGLGSAGRDITKDMAAKAFMDASETPEEYANNPHLYL